MEIKTDILKAAEEYVSELVQSQFTADFKFHNYEHIQEVVRACGEIANGFELSEREIELLLLAAWFHDTGYIGGALGHEERSTEIAATFMKKYDYKQEDIDLVGSCILVTRMATIPNTLLEQILCDADLSHLGKENYWDKCGRLRQELNITRDVVLSEQDWVSMELDFLKKHKYYTYIAHELYSKQKQKHIRQLRKRQLRLDPSLELTPEEILEKKEKKKNKKKRNKKKRNKKKGKSFELTSDNLELKHLDLGRGVETMYRTTYRTHVNLSSIADNKANIMLSINAIIISITISTMVPRFDTDTKLIIPTIVLLIVCLLSIVYATLSTRPKVTEGKFTRADIQNKKSNLLFFGNFYNMALKDFEWGMLEMIKDSDFLYSSMTRDLYFLGVVLAKKYKYLRICYGIFMYGLIFAVAVFAISFILPG